MYMQDLNYMSYVNGSALGLERESYLKGLTGNIFEIKHNNNLFFKCSNGGVIQ